MERSENAKGCDALGSIPASTDYGRQHNGSSSASFLKVTHLEQHVCCRQCRKAGDIFLSALSAVSLNLWISSTKEVVCLWASGSLGVAGLWVRSMGLNGSQKETVGCGAPSLQPAKENGDGEKASSSISRQKSFAFHLDPQYHSSPTYKLFKSEIKKKKSISISEWLSMPSVVLTWWPCQSVW